MNSISKENNFNFSRILVRRIILNWPITPKSTTHMKEVIGKAERSYWKSRKGHRSNKVYVQICHHGCLGPDI